MPLRPTDQFLLSQTRTAIDWVDDGLVGLFAARRKLVHAASRFKTRTGVPMRDPERERQVRSRGRALAAILKMPASSAERLLDLAIDDACSQQGFLTEAPNVHSHDSEHTATMRHSTSSETAPSDLSTSPWQRVLRLLPPPQRLAPLLSILVPMRHQRTLLERALARVLAAPLSEGSLDFMANRQLGIEVQDLRLRWIFELREGRLCVVDGEPEACVRGSATDLLLLAGRLEDADTLFFQRALVLTGDTELGLTVRNMLDRMPWERIPLGLRIALNRGGRFSRTARSAYRNRMT